MAEKKWMCLNCGYVYNPENGDPDGNIPPGTQWEDIPEDWKCPDCTSSKASFEYAEL
jgi:rubredoxin